MFGTFGIGTKWSSAGGDGGEGRKLFKILSKGL